MRVRIRGKHWTLVYTNALPNDADAHYEAPTTPNKQIRIRPNLSEARRLEMVLHECLHAAFWDLEEEAIESSAEDIARVLWRLGYRQEKQ